MEAVSKTALFFLCFSAINLHVDLNELCCTSVSMLHTEVQQYCVCICYTYSARHFKKCDTQWVRILQVLKSFVKQIKSNHILTTEGSLWQEHTPANCCCFSNIKRLRFLRNCLSFMLQHQPWGKPKEKDLLITKQLTWSFTIILALELLVH